MFDLEREQLRKTYQLCRLGFGLNAVALVLACFMSLLNLIGSFDRALVNWLGLSSWAFWVDAPIVWCSMIGTTLLWGRWDQVSWQRRSGLLLAMCVVDVGLWFIASGEMLGLRIGDFGHGWLREHIGQALGWAEFTLLSSLSASYLVHLGVEHASDSDKSARSTAATGAMIWMLLFCHQVHWAAGWPLRRRRPFNLESHLLLHGSMLIWTFTAIQVTALVISAVRQSSYVLEEMDREDQEDDLLRSRSEPPRDPEPLRSRRNAEHEFG
jgi:hypothetical protein